MAGPALTPELALEYLGELSTDIRAGVLLDSGGGLAASWENDAEKGARVRDLVVELLERAHDLSHQLQRAIRDRVHRADVLIHNEPESRRGGPPVSAG